MVVFFKEAGLVRFWDSTSERVPVLRAETSPARPGPQYRSEVALKNWPPQSFLNSFLFLFLNILCNIVLGCSTGTVPGPSAYGSLFGSHQPA